jgi:hypothetical protein
LAIIDPSHELRDFIRWEAGLNRKPYTSATPLVAHEIGLTACSANPQHDDVYRGGNLRTSGLVRTKPNEAS